MNKAKKISDLVKNLKGKRNIPIRMAEEKELPHISTASEDIQDRHNKMMDRGDHPETAARRLGYTTMDPKTNPRPKPNPPK